MAGFRLAKGGLIDRSTTLDFTFDGKSFSGHPGDTLASALIANGIHLMGRSFKYHRPRGVIAAGAAEPNALVELREGGRKEANTRATVIEQSYFGLNFMDHFHLLKSPKGWVIVDKIFYHEPPKK